MFIPFANPLQPLIDVLEQVLLFFHDSIGVGWGLAIILLTITVRLVLLPLTLKQVTSMQRLQVLAPEMRAIQAKYRDDKQRQQQEMMKFYRENRVNPLASCLPLLFQLPFFIALYYMLRSDLKVDMCPGIKEYAASIGTEALGRHLHAVRRLGLRGRAPHHGRRSELPLHPGPDGEGDRRGAGHPDRALRRRASSASGLLSSASMDRNQRMIMLGLPIVFVTFIINFPAGLLVYWITTNVWTIVQQLIVRKTVGVPRQPGCRRPPARLPGRLR